MQSIVNIIVWQFFKIKGVEGAIEEEFIAKTKEY